MVARYLEQMCAALGYAHARHVVHLDLKPLNLLLHDDGRLLLADFGLARLMEQGAIQGGASLQLGTPHYMAPEHWYGTPGAQSDVYALGVMLYQMLTGHLPFDADQVLAIGYQHATQVHPPLQNSRPDLPSALDAVISKALEKKPEARYHLASDLWMDFQATLLFSSKPRAASPVGPLNQTRHPAEESMQAAIKPVSGPQRRDTTPSPAHRASRSIRITEFQHYLHGVDYPATRADLLAKARENNAPPTMIVRLEELDEHHTFLNPRDVMIGYAYHRHLRGAPYPVTRDQLLAHARLTNAPPKLTGWIEELDETTTFADITEAVRSFSTHHRAEEEEVEAWDMNHSDF